MSTFFRYLMSIMVHLAWRRAGRGGPIPPMRLPGKAGKVVNLPIIGTWQLMAAMWVIQKFWGRYGANVKSHLANNANDLARRAATFLPDPIGATPATSAAGNASASAGNSASSNAPAPNYNATSATPNNANSPKVAPTPRPQPNLKTQPLSSIAPQNNATTDPASANHSPSTSSAPATAAQNGAPPNLPSGSLLSKLRGRL